MALNLKAAMGICLFFIAGLCYVVNRVALPTQAAAQTAVIAGGAQPADSSTFAARRLARQTPVESQRSASRQAAKVAADADPNQIRTVELPPVARPEASIKPSAMLAAEAPPAEPVLRVGPSVPEPAPISAVATRAEPEQANYEPLRPQVQLPATTKIESPKVVAVPPPAAPVEAAPAPRSEPVVGATYKVKKGDSLTRVVKELYGSSDPRYVKMLIEANPKIAKRTNNLLFGEDLVVPNAPGAAPTAPKTAAAQPAKAAGVAAQQPKTAPAPATATPPASEALAQKGSKAEAKAAAATDKKSKGSSKPASETVAAAEPSTKKASASGGARAAKSGAKTAAEAVADKPSKSNGKKAAKGASAAETPAEQWYTIRGSDSLASIAQDVLKDGRRWRELADVNGLRDPNKIVPGTRIKIPASAPGRG